jgi:hypothetical protein
MAKRVKPTAGNSGRPKRPADVNQLAHFLGGQSTNKPEPAEVTDAEIKRVMAELGRRGGRIGGKRRAASMTPERRREVALKAARKRWDSAKQLGC